MSLRDGRGEEERKREGGGGRMTHDHVLQGALGQPAVEKHWDEDVAYGRPEDLRNTMDYISRGCHVIFFKLLCYTKFTL